MTSTQHDDPSTTPLPDDLRSPDRSESRAARAGRPASPVAEERWLGDPRPHEPGRPARRPQGIGSIAAVGAVVLTSVVGMNALQGSAGAADQTGARGGFGGPPNGPAPTGRFGVSPGVTTTPSASAPVTAAKTPPPPAGP